jgi:hypothetical protein
MVQIIVIVVDRGIFAIPAPAAAAADNPAAGIGIVNSPESIGHRTAVIDSAIPVVVLIPGSVDHGVVIDV